MTNVKVTPAITDVCLLSGQIERDIDFYTNILGLSVRSRMPGFVDFYGHGMTLALWEASRITKDTGVPAQRERPTSHGVMLACELASPEEIDEMYQALVDRGVSLYDEPKDYPWNARCIYFSGPNLELWEFFAWNEGGMQGVEAKIGR